MQPLACWDCGFESRQDHGYLSVVSVVCWQVETIANSRYLGQKSQQMICVCWCVRGPLLSAVKYNNNRLEYTEQVEKV